MDTARELNYNEHFRGEGMKQKIFVGISLLLLLCCLSYTAAVYAEKLTKPPVEVIGEITDTTTNDIRVNEHYYDIRGAKLLTTSGRNATARDLTRGTGVKIHLEGDTVKYILIYDVHTVK